jgi:hypothetical protein
VPTRTALENKLEELFSVIEFVDGRRLGPAFRFLQEHRMEDESGKAAGVSRLGSDPAEAGADPSSPHAERSVEGPSAAHRSDILIGAGRKPWIMGPDQRPSHF